jgi:hypothetical protein
MQSRMLCFVLMSVLLCASALSLAACSRLQKPSPSIGAIECRLEVRGCGQYHAQIEQFIERHSISNDSGWHQISKEPPDGPRLVESSLDLYERDYTLLVEDATALLQMIEVLTEADQGAADNLRITDPCPSSVR